ncbi:MAG: hypothetical protein E7470_07100 [Ruminococcaceae bacterium]|nr:hypothetical protein [Oscillospiraceae bacterium]
MAQSRFYLRISNRTFEHFGGHGYVDAGGAPEEIIPLRKLWSLHLSVEDSIFNENGEEIGVRFKNRESGELHDVFPGEVCNINVWTTAVDDDGCPEDICISFYLEIIPAELVPEEIRSKE